MEARQRRAPKFSKILVAVDGSEESFHAADYAIGLLAKNDNGSELLIALSVIPLPMIYDIPSPPALEQWKEKGRVESREWFDRIRKNAEQNKVRIKEELISSPLPVEAIIVDYAEEQNVDVIVIGTRGRSGFKKMLLGSVASAVVTYATKPVLVVK